jgi:hypothetical protein
VRQIEDWDVALTQIMAKRALGAVPEIGRTEEQHMTIDADDPLVQKKSGAPSARRII